MTKKVIIVGAGAVGLCSAYFLYQKGWEVTIIDAGQEHQEDSCSYGNAGMIVPSHFVPLAAPGVVWQGLKWMFNRKSPLYIKPSLHPDLVQWMWKFYRHANSQHVNKCRSLLYQMNLESRRLFVQMIQEMKEDCGYKQDGLLMLYQTDKYEEEELRMAGKAADLGIDVAVLNPDEVYRQTGSLTPNVKGGVLYRSDAHLTPQELMTSLKKYLSSVGVSFLWGQKVNDFVKKGEVVAGVNTDAQEIVADAVVLCNGVWASQLTQKLGVRLPMQGGKGYSITLKSVKKQLMTPAILCERKIAMTPMGKDLRIAGTMEIAGYDRSINKRRVSAIKEYTPYYFPQIQQEDWSDSSVWAGLRPVSPDGLPYLGRLTRHKQVIVCAGHAMMGLSMSGISGKLVSQILANEDVEMDLQLLHPERMG